MLTAIRVSKYISQYMDPFETSATHLQTIPWMKLHLPSLGYQHLLATLRGRGDFFGSKNRISPSESETSIISAVECASAKGSIAYVKTCS